jgi:hypothetical protein
MPFLIALLVFVVVTLAVFAGMSLFDQRKAQARVLRDRLSAVQKPAEQTLPDVALLRDEVLSRIPAFDTFLRRSERVSLLQKMLAQGSVDVRAGNFLMLCAVSAAGLRRHRFIAGGNLLFAWVGVVLGFFHPLRLRLAHAHQALRRNLRRSFPRPSTRSPAPFAPDTPLPPLSK